MARVNGLLEDVEGQLNGLTLYKRNGKTFVRPSHIRQPHRLSRKQLLLRERQSHNNALLLPNMVLSDGPLPPHQLPTGRCGRATGSAHRSDQERGRQRYAVALCTEAVSHFLADIRRPVLRVKI